MLALVSERSHRLLWGLAAIRVAIVISRVLKLVVLRLEQRRPDEERDLIRLRRDRLHARRRRDLTL
jgi:hypothetical protein